MNVLSLFDGMSCGRIALERAGIEVTNYYASELDKYAIKVTQANWHKTIQLGDVTKWREWDIDWSSIDLLIGGSPCQGFSFAGKQLAFDDPRSKLFFVYSDILTHIDAERDKAGKSEAKFLLENVKMKKEYLEIISEHLGVKPVFINSALVSAQNRQRYYWANWNFDAPEDKGIMLTDVLEADFVDRDKSHCLDANYYKGGNLKSYFEKSRRQLVFKTVVFNHRVKGVTQDERGYRFNKGDAAKSGISELGRILKPTANYTDALTTTHMPKVALNDDVNKLKYRKLTPIECERLQTVPDNYTNHVSNTQRYKMLGNGWTVDVIAHIFKSMLGDCAKQVVKAKLITDDGEVFEGKNSCLNPQGQCPRDNAGFNSGEGYHLCLDVCKQQGHAEEMAIKLAGKKAYGSVIYLSGHDYACNRCKEIALDAGVLNINVVKDLPA